MIQNVDGVATLEGLEGVFSNTANVLLGGAGIVLFVMLLVGGFRYITAGADPKKAEMAQKTLTSAIIGLVIVVLAYLILKFIASFTGASGILKFDVYSGN